MSHAAQVLALLSSPDPKTPEQILDLYSTYIFTSVDVRGFDPSDVEYLPHIWKQRVWYFLELAKKVPDEVALKEFATLIQAFHRYPANKRLQRVENDQRLRSNKSIGETDKAYEARIQKNAQMALRENNSRIEYLTRKLAAQFLRIARKDPDLALKVFLQAKGNFILFQELEAQQGITGRCSAAGVLLRRMPSLQNRSPNLASQLT